MYPFPLRSLEELTLEGLLYLRRLVNRAIEQRIEEENDDEEGSDEW